MREIHDGLMYDTEKASKIGSCSNGYQKNELNYQQESLYVTKKGRYFFVKEGGGKSDYAENIGGSWGYGIYISPTNEDFAKKWAAENLDFDTYEKWFGPVEEA